MKIIKNNAKKLFMLTALATLTLCGVAQGMIADMRKINEKNIIGMWPPSIRRLINQKFKIIISNETYDILILNKKATAQAIAKYITKENFQQIFPTTIKDLLDADKSLAQTFAKYITEENFQQIFSTTIKGLLDADKTLVSTFAPYITKDTIQQIDYQTIDYLLEADKTLAPTLAQCITKDTIQQINNWTIRSLLEADKTLASTLAQCITKDTIQQIEPLIIDSLLKADKTLVSTFAQYITKENFQQIDPLIIEYLLNADNTLATTFAKYVTKENIQQIPSDTICYLLKADQTLAPIFAQWITKENIYKINTSTIENLVSTDQKTALFLAKLVSKNSNFELDHFIWDPQRLSNTLIILSKANKERSNLTLQKTSLSHQHFATTYEQVCNMFSERLDSDPALRGTLFNIVAREETELQKGRYTVAHGRRADRFVRDQIWLELQELFWQKPIDRTSWYPLHWRLPGKYNYRGEYMNKPYNDVASFIKTGRNGTNDRSSVNFASDLFGCKGGSSALDYTLRNENVGNYSTGETSEQLFEYFGWEKYYKLGAEYFERAEKLAAQMKYGALLLYSFTPEALERFVFVTHESGGYKSDITLIDSKDKEFDTNSPKKVLDTLLHNPENFKFKEKKYEYVIAVCDDHPTDKTKLGTQNPFNQELRTYHFNMGDDKKLADQIKQLVKAGFMAIKFEMIKDGVIKGPPKSRL